MARRPRAPAKLVGNPLPADWRVHNAAWRIAAMLAKIPDRDYQAVWSRFQASARGRLSENWMAEWKAFCRHMLTTVYGDAAKRKATAGLFE